MPKFSTPVKPIKAKHAGSASSTKTATSNSTTTSVKKDVRNIELDSDPEDNAVVDIDDDDDFGVSNINWTDLDHRKSRGIDLICNTNNKDMEQSSSRGNGTVVKFISAKIRHNATSHRWKEYNSRKVWTVNAKDVEWITVELTDNPEEINKIIDKIEKTKANNSINIETKQHELKRLETKLSQRRKQRQFKIKPEKRTVTINLKFLRDHELKTNIHTKCWFSQ